MIPTKLSIFLFFSFFNQPLARVRGLSAFDSGPKTTRSTFFHTFDVPGRYFITSEGTDRQLCTIDVLENGEIWKRTFDKVLSVTLAA